MKKRMFLGLCIGVFSLLFSKSVTEDVSAYERDLKLAISDSEAFNTFRRLDGVLAVFENVPWDFGQEFLRGLKKNYPEVYGRMEEFKVFDSVGSPLLLDFEGVGKFSGATLRYVYFAARMMNMFDLPKSPTIVELGGGCGGQCSVLSLFTDFTSYTLIDLPYVLPVVEKYLHEFNITKGIALDPSNSTQSEEYDLFISNFAISECSRDEQDEYIKNVIARAKRGFIVYNTFDRAYGHEEFLLKLKEVGIDAKTTKEEIQFCKTGERVTKLVYWGEK